MTTTSGSRPSAFSRQFTVIATAIAAAVALASCGGGGSGSASTQAVELELIRGKVIDGYVADAVVCLDVGMKGRCDGSAWRTRSDATGGYELAIPRGSTSPLVAEVAAGQSRDADLPTPFVAASYRMATPSPAYSTNITPFTTLVHLSAQKDYPLAEAIVRNVTGLPPRYPINVDYVATPDPLARAVAKSVVTALAAGAATLDMSAPGALQQVAGKLPPALTTLPELRITTRDAAPILSKEIYVEATFLLTNPALSNEPVALNGKIRGRGHSTWDQPKKPYKVQFSNDASYAKVNDFLGMRKNRNWVLLADYLDRSLLRNKLALSLANTGAFTDGLKWTPSAQHVEVVLNGEYAGVYLLAEDIRIDPARLDIRKMSTKPAVGDVDGGYIVEVDVRYFECYNQGGVNLQHVTPRGVPLCVDKPDEEDITPAQLAYVKAFVDAVEQDLYDLGSVRRINAASFADWYLLQELFRNNDAAFVTSDFMWKDTDAAAAPADRLLNMGPIWDFDLSAGNVSYNDNWKTEGCWVARDLGYLPNWLARLFANPEFVDLTIARWKQKRPAIAAFVDAGIDAWAARLDGGAQQRNFARWPILGMPIPYGGYYTFATHAGEVAFLKDFLNQRMAWLDKAYASPQSFAALCR
jgi:hypothetical protein